MVPSDYPIEPVLNPSDWGHLFLSSIMPFWGSFCASALVLTASLLPELSAANVDRQCVHFDTLYFSERAVELAQEPKELYVIPGLIHIDLYDHTNQSIPNLVDFSSHLQSSGLSRRRSCGCGV